MPSPETYVYIGSLPTIKKDPSAVLDYIFNWADYLAAISDTITTSTITAESGITIASQSNTTTTATAMISGGVNGTAYLVTSRIVTAGGRTDERSIRIDVINR